MDRTARYGQSIRRSPRNPIRSWQIWNEPNLTRYWNVAPWAPSYVALLKRADKALKAADPGSKTVLAGLPNESWKALHGDLRRGRARLVRRRRAAPVHGQAEERRADRQDRPARDGAPRRRQDADLGHRALVAGGAGQDRASTATSRRPTQGQATRLEEGPAAARRRAQAAQDRSRLLVHVALAPRASRTARSTTPGCGACAPASSSSAPALDAFSRVWHVACRAARSSRATHAAAADAAYASRPRAGARRGLRRCPGGTIDPAPAGGLARRPRRLPDAPARRLIFLARRLGGDGGSADRRVLA